MTPISELLSKYPPDITRGQPCSRHPETYACGICGNCGMNLCYDCYLDYNAKGSCAECGRGLPTVLFRLRTHALNPVAVLISSVLLLSAAYLVFGRERMNVISEISPGRETSQKEISLRNSLYLAKAARLKHYAAYMKEENKLAMAKRNYQKAGSAFTQVLEGIQNQFNVSLKPGIEDKAARTQLAELLIIIAGCDLEQGEVKEAMETLSRSVKINPESWTAGLAYYKLGEIYEHELKDYGEAIPMYREAQKFSLKTVHLLDDAIDSMGKPASERQIASSIHELAGSYDPAEAQHRIVGCYEKLGMKEKAREEQKILNEQYPFSSWADEAETPPGPEESGTERENEEESIRIVPLKE